MRERILAVDDDRDVVTHLRRRLGEAGFAVEVAATEVEALAALERRPFDLILLDVMLPEGDGFELLRRLVADRRTGTIPVIVLTAKGRIGDRVRALQLGADDYLVKPFDVEELEARVNTVLRRASQLRDLSPLTGLPGNRAITRELSSRVATGAPLAVAHVDIDDFKAFNDYYGFLRGDGVITFCARCLRDAAAENATHDLFVGHVGGDDFVVIMPPDVVDAFCVAAIRAWDHGIAALYDPADAARGAVEIPDRRGELRSYPLASLSIGVASNVHRTFTSEWEASAVAAEMKEHAKRKPGSSYEIDRRR